MCDQAENRTLISRVPLSVLVLLLLASLVAACNGSGMPTISPPVTSKPSVPKVTITAKEFSFAMPDGIQTGLVDFTVVNVGVQEHQAQFDRLNDGTTLDQLKAAVNQGRDAALSLITHEAGIGPITPGQSQEIILDLAAGHYVVLDLSSGADAVLNVAKGMITSFLVTGPSNEAGVSPPKTDVKVTLKDFRFVLPDTMKSGPLTMQVSNQGAQAHEMVLVKLAPGKTVSDALVYLQSPSGPPPGTVAGGLAVLGVGKTVWLMVHLAPGNYVTECSLLDAASGKSHAELGMIAAFTVH
jgi:hypothetical protein